MVRWIALAITCALTSPARAQTVMDGSDRSVSTTDMATVRMLFGRRLADPYGAQLDDLKVTAPGKLCGRFNAKNAIGGFVGFRPFGIGLPKRRLEIEPDDRITGRSRDELKVMLADAEAVLAICHPSER